MNGQWLKRTFEWEKKIKRPNDKSLLYLIFPKIFSNVYIKLDPDCIHIQEKQILLIDTKFVISQDVISWKKSFKNSFFCFSFFRNIFYFSYDMNNPKFRDSLPLTFFYKSLGSFSLNSTRPCNSLTRKRYLAYKLLLQWCTKLFLSKLNDFGCRRNKNFENPLPHSVIFYKLTFT